MARSYNVSFNINGALDGSLLAALQNAANAMRGLGNAARATTANARASQAGLQGLATSLNSLQQAAQRYQALQTAFRQTTFDFGRSGAALDAAKAKFQADTQAAEELRRKLSTLRQEMNQAQMAKAGESAGLKSLRDQMRELRRAYAEAKRAGDRVKTNQLKGQINSLGAAIQAQQQKVRQAAAAYKELADKARQMKTELKAAEQAAAASGQGLSRARQDADRLRQSYQQQLAALNQLKASLTAAGFNTSNFAASESRLAADINRVNAALARQTELINAQRASQQASQNMFNAYNNFQSALQTAETIAAPFKSAVENAMDFEHAMSRVKALTQSQNIREGNMAQVKADMKLLTQQARDLGATTMFTSTQAAQAMGYLGMAGWKTQQIYGTMPGMLDLAAAAGADLAQTADIVSDNMTAMGVPVEQAAHFMDVYAYALTNSNARLTDFGETMKYAAPVAKAYGSTLDETAAMVMMMANAGIKGSMAGTSLRMGLLRLAGPPKTATKEMAKLGLSLSDAQAGAEEAAAVIQSLGIDLSGATTSGEKMTRVLMQLHEKTKNLSQDEKLAAFKGIFGVNAETGWLALFDQGPEVFMKYVQGLRTADGYSKQVAATMLDDTRGALVMLQSAWDAFSERIGEALLPAVKATIEVFTPMVSAAAQWIEQHPAVVQACAAIAGALAGLIVAAAAVKLAFAGFAFITTSIQLVSTALASLGSGALLGGLIGRIAALRTALFGLGGAATIGGWGAMFGVISTKAMAAATAVRTFFAILTLGSVASGVTSVLSSIGTAIMGVARAALGLAFSPVGAALLALGAAAYFCYQNWDRVSAVLSTIGNLLTNSLGSAMAALEPAFANLSNALDNLLGNGTLQSALSGLGQLVTSVLATIITTIAGTLGTVINVAAQILATITNIITGIINLITSAINGNWTAAWESAKSIATSAFEGIGNVATAILDGILSTVRAISDAWNFLKGRDLPGTHGDEAHGGGSGDFGEPATTPTKPVAIPVSQAETPAPAPVAMPETPALDTSATQSALDAVGSSAQNAATNMDAVNTATQNISQAGEALSQLPANIQPVQEAMPQVATSATNASTALIQTGTSAQNVSTALTADATGLSSHTSALQANASALQANIGALQAFGAACQGAVGGVTALGSAAGTAGGQVGSMGSAASAVASALSAKAAEIGAIHISVPTVSVGGGQPAMQNYMGGIYRKGAFVTTFAERSAEAAIPLDGSRRAQDLWTQAGQILGLLPSSQPVTYETPRNRGETKYRGREMALRRGSRPAERTRRETFAIPYETPRNLPQLPKIITQTQSTNYDIQKIFTQAKDTIIRELPGQIISARASGVSAGGLIGKIIGALNPSKQSISFLPKIFTQTQPTNYDTQENFTQSKETVMRELPGQIISARASGVSAGGRIGKIIGALSPSKQSISFLPKIFTQTQPTTYDKTEIIKQPQDTLIRELPGKLISARASGKVDGGLLGKLLGAFKPQVTNVSFLPKIFTQTQPINYDLPRNFDDTGYRGQNVVLPQVSQTRRETFAKPYETPRNLPQLPKIITQTQPAMNLSMPLAGDTPNQLISAQDTAGLIDRSATTSATTLNVTINVNISGNADEQTVQRGVESALPALDDWLARHKDFQHEERRRSYA